MAMETRNGKDYYYGKKRIGRRVVSEYVGGGELGRLAAALAFHAQSEREAERAKERAERRRCREADAKADRASAVIQAAVGGALLACGFHRHKGQWRKRRAEHQP